MYILEALFCNFVFILFPLFCYFLFTTNERELNNRTNDILFDIALYSSLYFMLRYETSYEEIKMMFLVVPLLIAYLKKKKTAIVIFSISIAAYYILSVHINYVYVLVEFLIYFIFMFFLTKRKESNATIISVFALLKIAFVVVETNAVIVDYFDVIQDFIILPLSFYFVTHLICYLMISSERTMSLHMTIKELEKEKQMRDSLFKISHEIKNPIAVCKGYLDMFDVNNEDHVKRYIPVIKQEIERTLTLMNDFMMLTKINVIKRKMDATVLLQDVCEVINLPIKGKKIVFNSIIVDEDVYIDGDYDRLKQVFINVIKNSIEAIPADIKGIIELNSRVKGQKLITVITDNGVGMDKQLLSKIGKPFYTTKKGGTGLGVKFSKEIIDAHGGTIKYESKVKLGTKVTITLPLKKSFS